VRSSLSPCTDPIDPKPTPDHRLLYEGGSGHRRESVTGAQDEL